MLTSPISWIHKGGKKHCPWQVFLAALFMKEEKGFSRPQDITSPVATAKYICKSIIYQQCVNDSDLLGDFDM